MAVNAGTAASSMSQNFSQRSLLNTDSRKPLKAQDKSFVTSTTHGLPVSRSNSISSIRSEPAWNSRRHQSEPFVSTTTNYRKDSNASQLSVTSTASHKKSGFKGLFSRKDPAEKVKEKKQVERIVLGSKHAAAVKTKLMMDPQYRALKHDNPNAQVKSTGITEHAASSHLSALDQEMRHPHSGPPALHGSVNLPMLTRIESHDEPDDEIDPWEEQRRQWNNAKEHNLEFIREGSIDQPVSSSKRNSWHGSPQGDTQSDLVAKSVAERLETAA